MKAFEELKWRGLIKQTSSDEVEKLLNESKIKFYCGFDPTAPSLHVGSLLPIMTMLRLKLFGHTPIALAGGATGFVGDPSFKKDERSMLSEEQLKVNLEGISKNLTQILGDVELVNNFDWIKNISLLDFLKFQGKCFSVNNMISKDSVKDRIENPDRGISFTEFTYQLLQAEDFRHLFKTKDCVLQIGGSDQWGNCVAGIDLIRKTLGKEAFVMTIPLLLKSDGVKFGKSESGNVWLTESKTSVFDFFQFFIKVDDKDVVDLLKKLTFLSQDEIRVLDKETKDNPENRLAQKALAKEVTTIVHGKDSMEKALEQTQKLFGQIDLSTATADLEVSSSSTVLLSDLLVKTNLSSSKSGARRDMQGGGIRVNDQKELQDRELTSSEKAGSLILSKGKGQKKVIKFS